MKAGDKGAAAEAERPRETPEKISTITLVGMALVTIAMAKAMESTAPTLTTRVRVPLATLFRRDRTHEDTGGSGNAMIKVPPFIVAIKAPRLVQVSALHL